MSRGHAGWRRPDIRGNIGARGQVTVGRGAVGESLSTHQLVPNDSIAPWGCQNAGQYPGSHDSCLVALQDANMNESLPDDATLKELWEASVNLARGAGEVLLRYRPGSTHVDFKGKGDTDPVTEADLRVEEYLRDRITKEFPGHAIVAEESEESPATHDAEYVWAIDPVDGTANFAAGVPFFAVSIGLLHGGRPVVSSMFLPNTLAGDGVLSARAGGGAFDENGPLTALTGSAPRPSGLVGVPSGFARAFSVTRQGGGGLGEPRIMGSIACELALVARGVLQYSLLTSPRVWDVAAGVLLVQEAGGEVLVWRDGDWRSFERFPVSPPEGGRDPRRGLRGPSYPMLAGGRGIAAHVASRVRPRQRPLVVTLARRLGLRRSGRRGHR